MDAGDEGFPPPSDTSRSYSPPPSAASCSVSIPAAGEAREFRDMPPDSRPVEWFFFADALQAQLPVLLAVDTSIALDGTRPHGFVIAGLEGEAFAVPAQRDAVLGSIPAGEARRISWRAVVCTTTSRGQDEDAAGRALSLPAGPYVVLTKRARGSWHALLRAVADDGSLVRPSGYVVDAMGEYVASSLRGFLGSVDDVGGYWALAVPDGSEGDGRTWRIFLQSGQAAEAGSCHAHRRHSAADLLGCRLEQTAQSTSRRRRRFQEQRALPGVVWSRSSAPSRHPGQRQRRRWDEPEPPPVAATLPQPRCSSCHGREELVDRIMTCCGAVLCRGCAEVNPCGCPEWQNGRGFAVPILTDYHVDEEDCIVEGAVMLQRPRWHQFLAMRIGMDVLYGFYSVEDVYHSSGVGVTYQIHRYEMVEGRRCRRIHCLAFQIPSGILLCHFSFPSFVHYTPYVFIALRSYFRRERSIVLYMRRRS